MAFIRRRRFFRRRKAPWVSSLPAVPAVVTGAQVTQACVDAGTIAVAVVVTGDQLTEACVSDGSISSGAAREVEGAQETQACSTSGSIATQFGAPAGRAGVSIGRLRKAERNRRKFEEERQARVDAILNPPPLKPAPETVRMLAEVMSPDTIGFEDDNEEEEYILILLAS
jgi:hypothetical protein